MLKVTFNEPDNFRRNVDTYFDNQYDRNWFKDPVVKEIVKDIDKSELLDNGTVMSPIFGAIPVTKISGGTKALILMLKTDRIIWGTACGDNCAKWIQKIAEMKDITLFFEHLMKFEGDLNGICIDSGKEIKSQRDFTECWLRSQGV